MRGGKGCVEVALGEGGGYDEVAVGRWTEGPGCEGTSGEGRKVVLGVVMLSEGRKR